MARELFGTDGVRGRAGEFLTGELARSLGRAAVQRLANPGARVLIVRDTRESGPMLESALAAGIADAGGEALLGGVLPTPAAALLVRRHGLDFAAVISASHNPYEDNGIKFFSADGFKLDDEAEHAIEAGLAEPRDPSGALGQGTPAPGGGSPLHGALEDYLRELHTRFAGLDLSTLRVVLDCAHGATYEAAPEIFRRLGAEVTVLAAAPDGRNINAGCGSTHTDLIREHIGGHDIGFAFDGDGDRVLAVDRHGEVVDGDELVAIAALHLRGRNALPGDGVAVTVMTNYGFHHAMAAAGIEVAVTPVGDRYVLDELRRRDWALGGEQSGHIINLAFGPSGDGIASALLTLEALAGRDLAARDAMRKLPQRLINVRAPGRPQLAAAIDDARVQEALRREQEGLDGRGRVLLRASGTEPLVRVMVEAPGEEETHSVCERLAALVERAIAAR